MAISIGVNIAWRIIYTQRIQMCEINKFTINFLQGEMTQNDLHRFDIHFQLCIIETELKKNNQCVQSSERPKDTLTSDFDLNQSIIMQSELELTIIYITFGIFNYLYLPDSEISLNEYIYFPIFEKREMIIENI